MNFSQQIKHSNTDEWYTARENVEIIVPYLIRGGAKKSYAPSILKRANSSKY